MERDHGRRLGGWNGGLENPGNEGLFGLAMDVGSALLGKNREACQDVFLNNL
jgi:hypothetical protein